MQLLDLTLPTPAENLACDEALLDACEGDVGGEVLRFWEPRQHFVVVGYANRIAAEVNRGACEAGGIPVLRRCSGGGTVLQGPGCLNYSLILGIEDAGPLHSIGSANRFILERNRAALETLLGTEREGRESRVQIRGHTDLALGGLKFSGNAQRRRKRHLLFHGTFLLQLDLARMQQCLLMPSQQPGYRKNRSHLEFVTNLELPAAAVKDALRSAWSAGEFLADAPRETIGLLARDKYATAAWNEKF